jgi:Haem-binding domain
MKKLAKWILAVVLVVGIVMQFFNAKLTNPAVQPGADLMASNTPPAAIAKVLRAACYDCHSYETTWPWYSHVAPASWFLVSHVNEGREAMNFSDWPKDDPESAHLYLTRIAKRVQLGDMPIPSYTWIHGASRLTESQRKDLAAWATNAAAQLKY